MDTIVVSCVAAALVLVVVFVVARRIRHAKPISELAQRLDAAYPSRPPVSRAHTLRSPHGAVAIQDDALYLALAGTGPGDFHAVPWGAVLSALPGGHGAIRVRIEGVGAVRVPGALGHLIWHQMGSWRMLPATPTRTPPAPLPPPPADAPSVFLAPQELRSLVERSRLVRV
ncbi:MAG: hypothetical protein AAGK21_14045 [Bacteroidota bacterium]